MRMDALFIFVCFLVDSALSMLFPISYAPDDFIFIASLGFCALVLTLRKYQLLDAVLLAGCFGLFYDFFYANTYLINFILYILIAWLVCIWRKHMPETIFESIILCITTIFVKEGMLYCIMRIMDQTSLSVGEWFVNREFLTLTLNALMVFVLVSMIRIKDDYLLSKEKRIRKEEKIEWMKYLSKR